MMADTLQEVKSKVMQSGRGSRNPCNGKKGCGSLTLRKIITWRRSKPSKRTIAPGSGAKVIATQGLCGVSNPIA
eukprot:9792381-Ditylum_brightwellii.AAC.1